MLEPDRKSIEGLYSCIICGEDIYPEDGFWCCDYFKIGMYELDIDHHSIPKFWVKIPEV
jgi:hypothetical protein